MGEPGIDRSHHRSGFGDTAFEPQSNFDFAEQNENLGMLDGMGGPQHPYLDSMSGFSDSNPDQAMFGVSPIAGHWPNRYDDAFQQFSRHSGRDVDPSQMWHGAQQQQYGAGGHGMPYPNSVQSEIIKARGETVSETFGNLTPPEDYLPDAPSKTTTAKPPLDRSERARNAALQRHAKTKRARAAREARTSDSESGGAGSDVEVEDKKERYREKNRAAAAKCRAKKKTHVEKVELDARSLETENTVLKAKVRELRNQHSELRNFALQHNAAVPNCRCTAVHQYNLGKAAELTSTFGRYGPGAGHSPHDDILSPLLPSPGGFVADGRHQSFSGGAASTSRMANRRQSFSGPRPDNDDHESGPMEDACSGYLPH